MKDNDIVRGFAYVTELWENEQRKNETLEETKARHRKMAETADLALELANQCFSCGNWNSPEKKCDIKEIIINCPDWTKKEGE